MDSRCIKKPKQDHEAAKLATDAVDLEVAEPIADEQESPQERIEKAIVELNDSVGAELLDLIMESSPLFFEALVLDLLHAIGYGTSKSDLQRVGGSGDGGIDSIQTDFLYAAHATRPLFGDYASPPTRATMIPRRVVR